MSPHVPVPVMNSNESRPLSIIVAASDNDVIGFEGKLPWRLPADLRRFKKLTMNHHLIMGRKTYESIGRALPGRKSVVVTNNREFSATEIVCAYSVDDILGIVAEDTEPFVVGGAEIYRLLVPYVSKIYLTRVHCFVDGDAAFDAVRWNEWELTQHESFLRDGINEHDYSFFDYARK
jgi:dihydrofolate reductase